MRCFDDYGNELQDREIDLTVGFMTTGMVIKSEAKPIDNVTKFAWADEDYEEAYFYHPYPDKPREPSDKERIAELEAMLNALLGVSE